MPGMSEAPVTKRQRATKPAAPQPDKEFLEFAASVVDGDLITIDAESITVDRGRNFSRYYAPADKQTRELASSIEANGQIQEVILRPRNKGLELVVGYRRVAAVAMIPASRRPMVRAIVQVLTDKDAALRNIAENRDRENQSPIDVAFSLQSMIAMGVTREDIATTMRRTNAWITHRLSLLKLHPDIIARVHTGEVSVSAGEELAKLSKDKQLAAIAGVAKDEELKRLDHKHGEPGKDPGAKESKGRGARTPTRTQEIKTKARKASGKPDTVTVLSFRTWLKDLLSMPDHGKFEGQLAFSLLSYIDGDDSGAQESGNLYDLFAVVEEFIPESFDAALKKAGVPTWTDARHPGVKGHAEASAVDVAKALEKAKVKRRRRSAEATAENAKAAEPKKRRRVTPK